jgi:aldehyde:ferredoxin oxidoreductase
MGNGYMGKILEIDLLTRKIQTIDFPENVKKLYIGGSGTAAWYLNQETDPSKLDALGPENTFLLMTGPLGGTPVYSSSRYEVCAKAPLTGVWGEANSGGRIARDLKSAGYDGIILKNAADKSVRIFISQNKVEITDAGQLVGRDTYEMADILKSEYSENVNFAGIGPAGEKMVRMAAVMNDGYDGRAAGRGGLGAVLGSKKVKAIIVAPGKLQTPIHDAQALKSALKERAKEMKELPAALREFGTPIVVFPNQESGDLPIMNWAKGAWPDGAQKLSGTTMKKTILTRNYHCATCAIGCGRIVKVDSGPYALPESGGPEYETLAMLGAMCLVDDMQAVAKGNELCNRYNLDTISTGSAIAFGMEAFERGLISKKDTDGIELIWGNAPAMVEMVKAIGEKRGFGAILGQGVRQAAQIIGGPASEFAVHVKGMELPAHDPRARFSCVVSYATSNRGACHLNAFGMDFESGVVPPAGLGYDKAQDPHGVEGKAKFSMDMQNLMSVFDSLTICKFALFGGATVHDLVTWLNAVTGWGYDVKSLLQSGERAFTVKRIYNNRLGITRKDDQLPPRILRLPRDGSQAAGILPPAGKILSEYYKLRRWTEFGQPTPELLQELEIQA